MGNPDQKIIVVERDILFSDGNYFNGFKPHSDFDYEKIILKNLKTMRRGSTEEPIDHPSGNAELDTSNKQPIGYMLIVNPSSKEVYAFQRAKKDEHYSDKRLQGKWSWGVGGHIEPFDLNNGSKNPLTESRIRELEEEIEIEGDVEKIVPLGYINDDKDQVGKFHFGILYLVEINGTAKPKDKEMEQGFMYSVEKLEELCTSKDVEVESWSRISLTPLKKYLLNYALSGVQPKNSYSKII